MAGRIASGYIVRTEDWFGNSRGSVAAAYCLQNRWLGSISPSRGIHHHLTLDFSCLPCDFGLYTSIVQHAARFFKILDQLFEEASQARKLGALLLNVCPETRVVRLRCLQPRVELRLGRNNVWLEMRG